MKEFLVVTTAITALAAGPASKDTTKSCVQNKKVTKKTQKKTVVGEVNEENSFSIFNFTFKFQ